MMHKKRGGLGRGLSELLGDVVAPPVVEKQQSDVLYLPIERSEEHTSELQSQR
mgnify:CR=1 FL=1